MSISNPLLSAKRVPVWGNKRNFHFDFIDAGIYSLINLVNGKRYIGRAESISIRIKKHFSDLRHGKHHNRNLQDDYFIFGFSAFRVESLTYCDKSKIYELENYYIKMLDPEYNKNPSNLLTK